MSTTSVHRRRAARAAAPLAIAGAVLASGAPPAPAQEVTRGIDVLAGWHQRSDRLERPLLEMGYQAHPYEPGPTSVTVRSYERTFGATATRADDTRACVDVRKATSTTTKKGTTTTTATDSGCGSLSVRGLGTGIVDVTGSVPSSSGSGTLQVELRSLVATPFVRIPFKFCSSGTFPLWLCGEGNWGLRREGSTTGTVTSTRLGTFDVRALGGPTRVWELVSGAH